MATSESTLKQRQPADLVQQPSGMGECRGDWTISGIQGVNSRLQQWSVDDNIKVLDGSRVVRLDTTGALVMVQLMRQLNLQTVENLPREFADLLAVVARHEASDSHDGKETSLNPIAAIGYQTLWHIGNFKTFLSFLGEATLVLLATLARPLRIRWKILFANVQSAGANALPIVGLLSFLIGVVIAYQGGNQLKVYGANIFIVELVALTMLRELAPVITSIIVAGRTGSAFAAQIGTMKVTEEVDALRILGIHPFEILVVPKVLGLFIALPLLCLFADVLSLFGGMVVAYFLLDVHFTDFIQRLQEVVTPFSLIFGIIKAPVFAVVIAMLGCYQGFKVQGGADSVGRQTTQSVVMGIFAVILIDAIFAVLWGTVGIWR